MCDIIVIALESSRVSANAYEGGWFFEIALGAIPLSELEKKGGGRARKKLKQFFTLSESAGRVAAEDS